MPACFSELVIFPKPSISMNPVSEVTWRQDVSITCSISTQFLGGTFTLKRTPGSLRKIQTSNTNSATFNYFERGSLKTVHSVHYIWRQLDMISRINCSVFYLLVPLLLLASSVAAGILVLLLLVLLVVCLVRRKRQQDTKHLPIIFSQGLHSPGHTQFHKFKYTLSSKCFHIHSHFHLMLAFQWLRTIMKMIATMTMRM
uniref:Epidermal growth factor receptor-like transmembrane-juxtamembrane segment domain-containing protein n=1 Tax=Seriola dumerili TaxID=41447 RepID=A0A3B4TSB8_SERDU